MCHCVHPAVNHASIANRQDYVLHNYPSINVVPTPSVVPPQLRTVSENPYLTSADRTLFLWKSVFGLVYDNIYLALTDSKLLGWYLALSPVDRKTIQEEGGFHRFLKKHPALELSKHHVYVKKIIPEEAQGHFPLYNKNPSSSNQHLHTSYNNPSLHRVDPQVQELSKLTWQMANSSDGYNALKNRENIANCLDVELERHTQGTNPQNTSFEGVLHSSRHHSSGHDASLWDLRHETSLNADAFISILEADNSIVLCVPKESPDTSLCHLEDRVSNSEPSIFESIIRTTEDRSTSPIPSVCTCNAMVGTEQTTTTSAMSQTESPPTIDKHLNTEVYMLDLDYLTQEFITIKTERDALLDKVKMQRITSPFAKIVNDLKNLETDYNKMREKILSGISLQDLKPLSFDLEEATKDSTVAKIIDDIQKASLGSQQQENMMNSEPAAISDNNSLESETMRGANGKDPYKIKKAVSRVPKDKRPTHNTEGKPSDLNSNETWYDAEEDLPSEVIGQSKVDEKPDARDTADDTMKFMSAVLCVSGLPINVTEKDVLMWFEKYHASEVQISKLKELSVAIVIVESQQSAEAAVKELNGLKIKGHTLQIKHINTGQSEDQGQSFTCDPQSSNSPSKSQNQLTTSSSSSPKKKVVCVSPTAQGTFVPQHYGTMGSFDILMSELMQRHPSVGRLRIVDALLELRAKYRGVLSGLPLRAIRDMTSELLTRPVGNT